MLRVIVLGAMGRYAQALGELERAVSYATGIANPAFWEGLRDTKKKTDDVEKWASAARSALRELVECPVVSHVLPSSLLQELEHLLHRMVWEGLVITPMLDPDIETYPGVGDPQNSPLSEMAWKLLKALVEASNDNTAVASQVLDPLFQWEKPAEAAGHVQCVAPGNDPPLELLS